MTEIAERTQVLDIQTMTSQLAREIARNLVPIGEIRDRYRLSEDEYQRIVGSSFFEVRLQEELELWNASTPKAINERIEMKTLTMIEESLPEIFELIHNKDQPMSAKIEALKWASNVGGLIKRDSGSAASAVGERIKFNIFIGEKKVSFDKELDKPPIIEGEVINTGNP